MEPETTVSCARHLNGGVSRLKFAVLTEKLNGVSVNFQGGVRNVRMCVCNKGEHLGHLLWSVGVLFCHLLAHRLVDPAGNTNLSRPSRWEESQALPPGELGDVQQALG